MQNHIPILVKVEGDRFEVYSLTEIATDRDKFLMEHLEKMGGINESVEPGEYYFNVIEKDGNTIASLALIPPL